MRLVAAQQWLEVRSGPMVTSDRLSAERFGCSGPCLLDGLILSEVGIDVKKGSTAEMNIAEEVAQSVASPNR